MIDPGIHPLPGRMRPRPAALRDFAALCTIGARTGYTLTGYERTPARICMRCYALINRASPQGVCDAQLQRSSAHDLSFA